MSGNDDIETMTYVGFVDDDRQRVGPLAFAAIDLRTMEIVCASSWSDDGANALPDMIRRLRREPKRPPRPGAAEGERG